MHKLMDYVCDEKEQAFGSAFFLCKKNQKLLKKLLTFINLFDIMKLNLRKGSPQG